MTVNLPAAAKADICRRLAGAIEADNGQPGVLTAQTREELCDEYGLTSSRELIDLVTKHGYPRAESLKRAAELLNNPAAKQPVKAVAPPPAAPAPSANPITDLLAKAAGSSKARIKNLGAKIEGLLDDLELLVEKDEQLAQAAAAAEREKAEARAEVERLQKQLREAKAKLGKGDAIDGPSSADIRAWARDNGVDCPATGRVPKDVRTAYRKAHEAAA